MTAAPRSEKSRVTALLWWPGVVLACALLVASRRPDLLLHASFWAEDGWNWYPDAYNEGWRALLVPWTGYLQTASRLVALFAQPFPLRWAPTVFAAGAVLIQATAAAFLVSHRLAGAAPRPARLIFALVYLLLPNSFEVYANLTNVQWHLAFLAFLVTIADRPATRAAWLFDMAALLLSGLSGPFCIVLAPVAVWRALHNRDRASTARALIVAAAALLQLWCLLGGGLHRVASPLGASPRRFVSIVSTQIILPVLFGRHSTQALIRLAASTHGVVPLAATLLAGLAVLRVLLAGPAAVRYGIAYAAGVFAAALLSPVGSGSQPAWLIMSQPDLGDRYYILPMLAWTAVLLALAADAHLWIRAAGLVLVGVMLLELPGDWHLPTSFDFDGRTDFVSRAERFAVSPPGTTMRFPLRPAGVQPMVLHKH